MFTQILDPMGNLFFTWLEALIPVGVLLILALSPGRDGRCACLGPAAFPWCCAHGPPTTGMTQGVRYCWMATSTPSTTVSTML
jgi:hypothetical protein